MAHLAIRSRIRDPDRTHRSAPRLPSRPPASRLSCSHGVALIPGVMTDIGPTPTEPNAAVEPGEQLGKLDCDIAAAEDDERLGQLVEAHGLVGVEQIAGQAGHGIRPGMADTVGWLPS